MRPIYNRRAVLHSAIIPAIFGVLAISLFWALNSIALPQSQDLIKLLTPYLSFAKVEFIGITVENPPAILLLLIILITVTTTLLIILQNQIIRIYTGELFADTILGRVLIRRHRNKFRRVREKAEQAIINSGIPDTLSNQQLSTIQDLDNLLVMYPYNESGFRPTLIGNILATMSYRIKERYGFDLSLLWGHLLHLSPDNYRKELEDSQIAVQAYLNGSFVFLVASLFILTISTVSNILTFSTLNWLLIFFLISLSMYRLSLQTAVVYSSVVQEGIDLYRTEILKGMHFPIPRNQEEERRFWIEISRSLFRNYPPRIEYPSNQEADNNSKHVVIEHQVATSLINTLSHLIMLAYSVVAVIFVMHLMRIIFKNRGKRNA